MAQRIRVGIVFGGVSSEHDVSCMTAGGVSRAIDADRFEVVGIGTIRFAFGNREDNFRHRRNYTTNTPPAPLALYPLF